MSRALLVGSLVLGAAILTVVFWWDRPKPVYSLGVTEFLSRKLWDQRVRVQGRLVHGTLCRSDAECGYRFRLADASFWNPDAGTFRSDEDLSVSYDACVVPDSLKDLPGKDVMVTVEGERCHGCHDFKATNVLVKSGGKYEFKKVEDSVFVPMPRCRALSGRL